MNPARDRALGALLGLAVGDALGMPTQSLSRSAIAERYGVVGKPLPESFFGQLLYPFMGKAIKG